MQAVPEQPNVLLRPLPEGDGQEVVLAFPYDGNLVAAVRTLPGRKFDWDRREWSAPADGWVAAKLTEILRGRPELTRTSEFDQWLEATERRWTGYVRATRYDGSGWFVLDTQGGTPPEALRTGALIQDKRWLVPLTAASTETLLELHDAKFTLGARRCMEALEHGEVPPAARLILTRSVAGERFVLEPFWDNEIQFAFEQQLPGAIRNELKLDPWIVEQLDAFLALHEVHVAPLAADALADLAEQQRAAQRAVAASRAISAEPIPEVAARMGGDLAPFQWAAVRYALEAKRTFLADEQGLGKTVEALATLEAADAFPAIVVCPASMKLVWQRETQKWLPHRSVTVVTGRGGTIEHADITIINYEIAAARREALARRRPLALVADESHYCKNPQAKRTQAVRRLAESVPDSGLRLALTGTPVMNHADELIPQLRLIGRLADFGSGASFSRQFEGELSEERLHWHLRRHCFVRRLKSEVLPQLPAKRQVVVPVALNNESEYRLAEDDVIAWLRAQPLDLKVLDGKIAAALRAERLAQLTTLQRLAARGKLAAALTWIHDFLASGEALVVFARHVEVQKAVIEHFPHALHLLGEDSAAAREQSIAAFQDPDGPALIVCATRVAAQGITLTRASNVCFLELEWTPAIHDQAEDRCHRIGQRDAVTAWYLLAAETIDETMARLIQRKREIVDAITDGRELPDGGLIEGVVRELRDGMPFRHLHAVASDTGADAQLAGDAGKRWRKRGSSS
jgi:SWI/SNF-related matrix-associated actin-dependent regulator of chromatin subfamily A-like protein 1